MAQMCITKGLLLLLICVSDVISLCQPPQPKVTVPSSVTVKRGGTVNISSDSFQVKSQSDQCRVYSISTPTFSCGAVSPDVFDCYKFSYLSYTHYGCDADTENLDFAVYLISSNQTVLNTKYLTVKVKVENDNDVVLPAFDTIIVPSDAMSVPVTLKLLTEDLTCEYAIVSPMRLPYYGNLTGPIGRWLACNSNHIFEYSLHSNHQPPKLEDRIIATVRFVNGATHYVQIRMVINDSNVESCNDTQGVLPLSFSTYTPVSVKHLLPNCSATLERDWKISIAESNRVISAITSYGAHAIFTVEQLQSGLVSLCTGFSEVSIPDKYYYTIHDVFGKPIFNSSVITRQTLTGTHVEITTNDGINVLEGHSALVTSDILQFVAHNCSNFTINLIEPPKHGQFISAETNKTQTKFIISKDLKGNIIFQHSGNNNFADRAIWEIQCFGNSIGNFLQPIRVTTLDDSPPFLVSKSVMSVGAYEIVQISFVELQASDVDSCDADIRYNISQIKGTLFSTRLEALSYGGDGLLEFIQSDINSGNIWYRPPDNTDIRKDIILFSLSDDSSPPNVLSNQQLKINILPMNIPEVPLNPGSLMKMPMVEMANMTLLLPTDFSWFTEQFPWLEIAVLVPPQSGKLSLIQFTLEDLENGRVTYRHYGLDQNCKDSFVFQMNNSSGADMFGKLVIAVVNLNVTHDVSLQVNPIGFSNIRPALSPNSIVVLDSPVCDDLLLFNIETAPKIGTLYISKSLHSVTKLSSGSWFSLQDVRDGYVVYVHSSLYNNTDNNNYKDEFSFSLSSPIGNLTANGNKSVSYSIVYTMVDPVVVLNSPSTLYPCQGSRQHQYCYNLSSVNIDVKSQVANDSEIIIDVEFEGLPSYGRLMNTNGRQSNTFTMLELRNKLVIYEVDLNLWQNSISMDSFTFFVRVDTQRVKSQQSYTLKLMWNYIYMEEPKLEVNETDGEFNVTVR